MIFSVDKLQPFTDSRGIFLKLMEDGTYPKNYKIKSKRFKPIQTFLSVTKKNAIRGMHFYNYSSAEGKFSADVAKIGFCKSFVVISGEIFLAGVDLQNDSKSFGTIETLNVGTYTQISIPRMVATGFQVISKQATVLYFIDSVHKTDEDITINPISCGIDWPLTLGEMSNRDANGITLEKYLGLYK